VKAISSGSSIDVFVCKAPAECAAQASTAIQQVVRKYGAALVEKFIDGTELTVGLLEEKPLAPIRIVPKREFFDYEAKYKATDTEHRFDTGLPQGVVEQCRELARKANAVVGARDLARIDIMVDRQQQPFLLEINTLPGFTPVSLLPEAARHAGIEFGPLVDLLVRRAFDRHRKARACA
jgi:D-alanine-D-alanine ligase